MVAFFSPVLYLSRCHIDVSLLLRPIAKSKLLPRTTNLVDIRESQQYDRVELTMLFTIHAAQACSEKVKTLSHMRVHTDTQ